jgi:acyl transferase domain-containing protein
LEHQESVIRAALRDAKAEARQLQYIEAHGTGTQLGDSIEMAALEAVMRSAAAPSEDRKCLVASAKANIGHLEAAAGTWVQSCTS